jgi:UDPglucose--hexose-1-phosphate uridylyltransferase
MPELRKDPIIGRWVIISTERAMRPDSFEENTNHFRSGFCPFCYGNEERTPPEVLAYRKNDPNTPGWTLRVVPNKFPALYVEGNLDRRGEGMFDKMNGIGAHEVIIETPEHDQQLVDLPISRVENIIWSFRDRYVDLKKDSRFQYILIFKNHGRAAGATLEHSHSQLIALPVIPKRVTEELAGAKRYFSYKERCVYCDIIRQEMNDGSRVILENDKFISLAPFCPRFPFETWIIPKSHEDCFEDSQKKEMGQLAEILQNTLKRMNKSLNTPPYNFLIHTSPIVKQYQHYYHWHIEIMPKLTKVAGFEWGTGFYINPTSPEESARFMREVEL